MTNFFSQMTSIIKATTDVTVAQTKGKAVRSTPPQSATTSSVPDFTTVRRKVPPSSSIAADTRAAEDEAVLRELRAHKRKQVAEAQSAFMHMERNAGNTEPTSKGFQPPLPRSSAADINPAARAPRTLAPDLDARLRGGKQRLTTREAMLERLMTDSGNITDEERRALVKLLEVGHQV